MVTDSGFWDAYSTVYPWLSFSYTDTLGPMLEGWVNSYKQVNWLPTWPSPNQRDSMVGTMGDSTLADAIVKNIGGFDKQTAFEAIYKDATSNPSMQNMGRKCLHEYISQGYVSIECETRDSAGRSIYYYIADASIAKAAKYMQTHEYQSQPQQAQKMQEAHDLLWGRAMNYKKLFNPNSQFFQTKRSNGNFAEDFRSKRWEAGFTEASAEQFRFNVPFDVPGLNELMGGKICENIHQLLTMTTGDAYELAGSNAYHEMKETQHIQKYVGLLGHSNQPSHHVLYVAVKAGCFNTADRFIRTVMNHKNEMYTENGYIGDEDNGEMAAWYTLSAFGLYFLDLGSDEVVLGCPSVGYGELAVVDPVTKQPRVLIIDAHNNSEENMLVSRVTWTPSSGARQGVEQELPGRVVGYSLIAQGGTLNFHMGPGKVQTTLRRRLMNFKK